MVGWNYFKLKMVQNRFQPGNGSAPDPAEGAFYDAPPHSLIDWGWGPFLIRFPFDAFGVWRGGLVVWWAQCPQKC